LWLARHHNVVRQAVERAVLSASVAHPRPPPPQLPLAAMHTLQGEEEAHVRRLSSPDNTPNTPNAPVSPPRGGSHGGSLSSDVKPKESMGSRKTNNSHRSAFVKSLTGAGGVDSFMDRPVDLRGKLRGQMRRAHFEPIIGILIVLNAVFVFVELQVCGEKGDRALSGEEQPPLMTEIDYLFKVLEHCFNAAFLLEVLVRLCVDRSQYCCSFSNVLDLLAVVATSIDLYILQNLAPQTRQNFLATMRMLRLCRLLRIIRMIDIFQPLRVLMHSVVLSFMSIFWSLLILLLFMFEGSLLLCQLLQPYVLDEAGVLKDREWAHRYYGNSVKSLYTIFEATFSGCWPGYARELVENVSPWYAAFFVPYVTFVIFTLIRIIYALLLKETLQAAAQDADVVIQNKMRETTQLVKKLSDLFAEADASGDGYLGRDEFEQILAYPRVQTWMSALGLDTQDTNLLFSILDDGENPDGKISQKEFVNGILRLKGHEQKQDLLVSARDMSRILNHCKHMEAEMASLSEALRDRFRFPTPTLRV